jgi:hypothetical protein
MPSDKEIEGYARECVRLAQLTTDPQTVNDFSKWPASGWRSPCTKKTRQS